MLALLAAAAGCSVATGEPLREGEVQKAEQTPELVAKIDALEVEHQSLLSRTAATQHWTSPVLDADSHLFSWRMAAAPGGSDRGDAAAAAARNVTQVSATLTLTTAGRAPIVCHPEGASDLSLFCGSATAWSPRSARYLATLDVELRAADGATAHATAQGSFVRGLQRSADGWGGAEWIGLTDANDTAAQFRSVSCHGPLEVAPLSEDCSLSGGKSTHVGLRQCFRCDARNALRRGAWRSPRLDQRPCAGSLRRPRLGYRMVQSHLLFQRRRDARCGCSR